MLTAEPSPQTAAVLLPRQRGVSGEPSPRQLRTVIFLGMNPWSHGAINDTVRFLARAASGVDRIYIEPPQGLKNTLANFRSLAGATRWQERVDHDVRIFAPPLGFAPVALGLRDRANRLAAAQFERILRHRCGDAWREEALVYISSWSFTETSFIRRLNPRYLIFHILDDSFAFPMIRDDPRVLAENRKFFKYIMARSSLVIAVSGELAAKYGALYNREIAVVRNGVDVAHFRHAADGGHDADRGITAARAGVSAACGDSNSLQQDSGQPGNGSGTANGPAAVDTGALDLTRPVLMYVGSINSWVDLDLLLVLARTRPGYSLALIGHCYEETVDPEKWRELLSQPNVSWLGSRPYAQVPDYLRLAAVLLLPRTEAEHSRASDPLKLYEYLSTGKPVVSTALPAIDDFRELVYVSGSPAEFTALVDAALERHDPEHAQRQLEVVTNHSWEARLQEISDLLAKYQGITL